MARPAERIPTFEELNLAVQALLPLYARAGVAHVWLVDSEQRSIEVYETRDASPVRILTAEGSAITALPPFPELELPLAPLWGR